MDSDGRLDFFFVLDKLAELAEAVDCFAGCCGWSVFGLWPFGESALVVDAGAGGDGDLVGVVVCGIGGGGGGGGGGLFLRLAFFNWMEPQALSP